MTKLFSTTIFFFLCTFCFAQKGAALSFQKIWSGKNSEIYDESLTTINSEKEYKALCEKIKDPLKPAVPDKVDFNKEIVIFYFAGDQTNGADVSKVEKVNNEILITIDRFSASRNCHDAALLVTPYFLIKLQKCPECTVRYVSQVKIINCE